jgi:hypothetical protein
VGHQRGDITVTKVEDPLNDLLLCFIDRSGFGTFSDKGLDLFFRNRVIF